MTIALVLLEEIRSLLMPLQLHRIQLPHVPLRYMPLVVVRRLHKISWGDNNGSELSTIGQQLLENIRFNAVKVQPIAGQSPVTINPNDPSTYNVVGSVISGTTDSNGTAVLPIGASDANDGYYLVRQATQSGGITTISPFIVQMPYDDTSTNPDGTWVYDVNVYPKLAGSGSKGSDKLIDLGDGTQTNKQSSVFAGGDVTWNLVTVFSPSMRAIQEGSPSPTTVYGSFLLTDQLSDNLVYESISFDVGLQSTTDNTVSAVTSLNFISGTDYTLNTTNNQLTLTLTDAGIDKVLAILPTPVNANQQPVFIPNVTTSVVSDFEYGQIGNSYSTEITNAFWGRFVCIFIKWSYTCLSSRQHGNSDNHA